LYRRVERHRHDSADPSFRDALHLARITRGGPLPTGVYHLSCDLLKHLLVQHQLDHQDIESVDLGLRLAAAALAVVLGGGVPMLPVVIPRSSI
jgi:hypothetical protein